LGLHPWASTSLTATLAVFEGDALPPATSGTAVGPYDPSLDAASCASALTAMVPGSTVSGTTLVTDPNALDDGPNAADGVAIVVDDLDPGEVLSLNWVVTTPDGVAGYVDADGVLHGEAMGFGRLDVARFGGGVAPEPVLDDGVGFSPSTAFDPDLDSPYLWVEDEVGGVDGFPVNPVAPWFPGAGTYLAAEAMAERTGPFARSSDADVAFEGVDVTMAPTSGVVGAAMALEAPRWVLPGDPVDLVVTGAVPGDAVWFVYGTAEGRGRCLPALQGDCLEVRGATAVGQVTADGDGRAVLRLDVPDTAALDQTLYLQAVAFRAGSHTRSAVRPPSTGYDPAVPCPILGDADGDAVCDDVDACEGEDLFGDTDGDGRCDDLDVCVGDDAIGDLDGDGVCDDLDLCDGDDALGDPDGDGACGGIADPCEGKRGCAQFVTTEVWQSSRIPELNGATFEVAIGFQGTWNTCVDDGIFGGSARWGTFPGEQVAVRVTASTPQAQAYFDALPIVDVDAEFYLPFADVNVSFGGLDFRVDTQYSFWPCFGTWGGGTLGGWDRPITVNGRDTVDGDFTFRFTMP
jgi:hypothetical protein